MFGKKEVQISLGANLDKQQAHGLLWARPLVNAETNEIAKAMKDGFQAVPFRADAPEHLRRPGRSTIRGIFEQARAMGFELLHVELQVEGELKLYGHP
jgi:hypothetical protein